MMTSDPTSDSSSNRGSSEQDCNHLSLSSEQDSEMSSIASRNIISLGSSASTSCIGGNRPSSSSAGCSESYNEQTHIGTRSWNSNDDGSSSVDGNTRAPTKKGCNSEFSDCGYETQLENEGSISTSSNEDESPNDMNMKALLLHHTPNNENITQLLKEFTIELPLKGYSCLVHQLRLQLLTSLHVHINTSHSLWLITNFLKRASQTKLDLENVSPVLSYDTVSYLTYEGVNLCEQLEILKQQHQTNLSPLIQRMHLVVTALREVLQTVEVYKKFSHLGEKDEKKIKHLQEQISSTEELKYLFLLLLRYFDPTLQSKQYLQDVIVTNHNLLIFLENCDRPAKSFNQTSIPDHIKQFANGDIMKQYGLLLEHFEENGEFVNNCIFTMMHHVAGDINQVDKLIQPPILKTFFKIWESDFEICDDWSDLIGYVVLKFLSFSVLQPDHKKLKHKDCLSSRWSKDHSKNLHKYCVESACSSHLISKVLNSSMESGVLNKNRIEDPLSKSSKENNNNNNNNNTSTESADESSSEIKVLLDHLINENKENCVIWLKSCLLEACHAKLSMKHKMSSVEPIPYHFALLKQSIPMVSWTKDQSDALQYKPFVLLLHKLGLHLPSDSGKIFVRIPNFWTSDIIYSTAQKLGPVNSDDLKFDLQLLEESNNSGLNVESESSVQNGPSTPAQMKQSSSFVGSTPNNVQCDCVSSGSDLCVIDEGSCSHQHFPLISSKI